jgi:hypothetical protein
MDGTNFLGLFFEVNAACFTNNFGKGLLDFYYYDPKILLLVNQYIAGVRALVLLPVQGTGGFTAVACSGWTVTKKTTVWFTGPLTRQSPAMCVGWPDSVGFPPAEIGFRRCLQKQWAVSVDAFDNFVLKGKHVSVERCWVSSAGGEMASGMASLSHTVFGR